MGMDEVKKSLIGKIFGEKKTNFMGMRNAIMKIWHHKGLCKVVALIFNVYQFIFTSIAERDEILHGRPWFFDNKLLVVHLWSEKLNKRMDCFNISPILVQVWNTPPH